MERILGRYSDVLFAMVRVVAAFLFFCHGLQKFGWFGRDPVALASLRGVAGVIEVVGGPLIALGLFTSVLSFIASGLMAAAYFIVHQPRGAVPVLNGGELAAMLCFFWLYLSSRGPGRWSLDAMLAARRRSERQVQATGS